MIQHAPHIIWWPAYRCGWALVGLAILAAYLCFVGLVCMFMKGCSIREDEEKISEEGREEQ
jgi:hypothetical protein